MTGYTVPNPNRPRFIPDEPWSEKGYHDKFELYIFHGFFALLVGLAVGLFIAGGVMSSAMGLPDAITVPALFGFVIGTPVAHFARVEWLPHAFGELEFEFREQASAYTQFNKLSREDQGLALPAYNHLMAVKHGMEYGTLSNAHQIWKSTHSEILKRNQLLAPPPESLDDGDAQTNLEAIRAGNKAMEQYHQTHKGIES